MAEKEINLSQTNPPLVSVIIPCYNAERYVETAVRSIMEQTYTNLEILCCDDCSADGTLPILQRLATEDSRIRLFRNEENLKIVRTLNSLVSTANGKYIVRMDADDISLSQRIERQVAFLESHPDYALCGTNAWHIDKNGHRIGRSCLPIANYEIQRTKYTKCPFYHPTVCVKSEILKSNLYCLNFEMVEDFELWIRILKSHKAANLPKRLIQYRKHASSISFSYSEKILEKLTCIFTENTNFDAQNAKDYVNAFFVKAETTASAEVKRFVFSNYCMMNSTLNPACFRKELVFAKKNKMLFKFLIVKPFLIFLFFIKLFFFYFGV